MPTKKPHAQLQQTHNHYNHENRRRSISPPSPASRRNHSVERDSNHEHRNGLMGYLNNQNKSDSPSNHRNGTNIGSHNGSNDLLNACSPIALLSGMQFKLSSRGKCHEIKFYSAYHPILIYLNLNRFRNW